MKKKYIIIVAIIITLLLILGILKFINNFKEDSTNQQAKITEITTTYEKIKEYITNYNSTRETLSNSLSTYYQDTFKNNYNDIIRILQEYDQIIGNIQENIELINKDCDNNIFNDVTANTICNNYEETYEQLINTYINDINNINSIIDTYNNENTNPLNKFNSNYINDYIDYNNDGEYIGRE